MKIDARAIVVLVAAMGGGAAVADDDARVPVVVDGRPGTAWGWSLDGAASPAALDDVVFVDPLWPVTLGAGTPPSFRSDVRSLHEVGADGKPYLVGVALEPAHPGGSLGARGFLPPRHGGAPGRAAPDASPANEPNRDVLALSDAQVAKVRSVRVRGWSGEAAAFLARVDPASTCVWIQDDLEAALPHLPARLRYLLATGPMPADLSGIARLTDLRFLVLRGVVSTPLDLRPLSGLVDLRVLEVPEGTVEHVETLGRLRSLRELSLARCASLLDLAWLRGCAALRRLDVSHTPLSDLSPAGELPFLEHVDAHLSSVRVLPAGPCAALRSLRLGSPVASPETLAAFRAAHPACEIVPGRKDRLLAAVAGADRLRVRTGGMCHRDPKNEVVRFESTAPEAIAEVLALLEIDDCGGHSGCMCCGNPTFEFHSGSVLLASVSLHHGHSLRTDAKAWHGDVPLTAAARLALARWLERHGEREPMDLIESSERRETAARVREERQSALLGPDRLSALRADLAAAGDYGRYPAVLRRLEPDLDRRVLLALRLRGAAGDEEGDDVTYAARYSLFADPAEAVVRIGGAASDDAEAHRGFAFWLLSHGGTRGLGDATLDEVVPPAALRLLSDSDLDVRRNAIWSLGRVARPFSVEILRHVLAGQRIGPSGTWEAAGERETDDLVAAAASALVEAGDAESLPAARAAAARLHGAERRRLLEAIDELAEKASPK
jgi:hypothetical protein